MEPTGKVRKQEVERGANQNRTRHIIISFHCLSFLGGFNPFLKRNFDCGKGMKDSERGADR